MCRTTDSSIFGLTQETTNTEIDSLDDHGKNHNSSESDEGNRAQCMFCSAFRLSFQSFNPRCATPLERYQFLHEECSTCRPDTQLCDFCRHLRLRHILSCVSERNYKWVGYYVDFGGLEAIRSRENCGLCRLVADAVFIHAPEAAEGYLSSILNVTTLDIYLQRGKHPILAIRSDLSQKAVYIEFEGEFLRTSTSERPIFGKQIWPAPLGKEISWDRIRKSLPNITPDPTGPLPSHFRLIDVLQRRCVTVGPSFDGSFAALSYVWGSAMGVSEAGPAADLKNLPHTIEDALHACKELGQQYLWIDQVCINQNDPADKASQIASMAAIYSSASFVIVAAGGESVHSGISGMHLARRELQARASFIDFELFSVPDFNRDVSNSIWSTRGWTLQEVALAKSKVYFSSTGIWLNFEKNETEFLHNVDFNQTMSKHIFGKNNALYAFSKLLESYTSRRLTYEYDIYNAFSGIMAVLFGGPDKDIYGLPELNFSQALLWALNKSGPPPSIRVVRNHVGQDPALNPLLPTWSWASVTGGVQIAYARKRENTIRLVKWARIAPSSQPLTPTLIDEEYKQKWFQWEDKMNESIGPAFYLAILWSYSGFDSPSPFAPLQPDDYTHPSERDLEKRWPAPRDFWHEVSSRGSKSPTYPGLDIPGLTSQDDSKISQLQPGVLLTRAQSTFVWVDPDCQFRDGDHGALIGWLYGLHRGLILRGDSPKVGFFKCIAISLANGEDQTRSLIKRRYPGSSETRKGTLSDEDLNFPRGDWNSSRPPPVVNVMLIGRDGPFSYRLGIGCVLLRRWILAQRVFKTILLK